MAVLGFAITAGSLVQMMSTLSTRIHSAIYDWKAADQILNNVLDADLVAAFVANGSTPEEAAILVNDLRSWQINMNGLAQNYEGAGSVANRAFDISKRANFR